MRNKTLMIIFVFVCLLILVGCGRKKTEVDKYGIKVVDYESRFASHVWGGVYRAMYYKGKEICHYINGYTVSPDVKYILYINWEVQPCRYEIYVVDENQKAIFPQMEYNTNVDLNDEYSKFEWKKEVVILSDLRFKIILYMKQNLLEKESLKKRDIEDNDLSDFYEYLITLGNQLYIKLNKNDQLSYKIKFDFFIKKYQILHRIDILMLELEKHPDILDNLGEQLKDILSTLKNNYSDTLV